MTTNSVTENLMNLPPNVDIRKAFNTEPTPRDYVLPSFPVGKVGLLASAGGTGKSFYALQMLFQVSAGRCCDFSLGKTSMSNDPCQVLYVSLEDEAQDIESRLNALWQYWKSDKEKSGWLDDLADFVEIIGLAGLGSTLVDSSGENTACFNAITEKAQSMPCLRFIVVDTLRRAHDGDENSNGFMSQVLRYFEKLAHTTGAAILLLHHENKGGMGDMDAGSSSVRGASAIVDNARYVARMQTMTPDEAKKRGMSDDDRRFFVRVTLEKTNYGPPQEGAWLRRENGGILIAKEPPCINNKQSGGDNGAKTFSKKYKTAKDIFG
ncbi:regulatory protein RepA [Bathymodiolus japonicus methanotrophic gill symbiont]|uniref:AAA family ATPase n=1 Tax=Bathymodiolus japonicus methanotrophic gill symbiont TaxID=113269 RepID=UPI001B4CBB94|nr:helicase RepA family protein [Bathymodiolus japonicus methanotrophic gill symbiont]GFO72793.1 regulatory protein RepA [Bathymodiolus japonicus methanotrophic gill symbiont]